MPYARKRRSRSMSRGRIAKRRRYNQVATRRKLHRLRSGGLPVKRTVKMRYCQQFVMTSTSGTMATQVFRSNSIFDPDLTGVGHQPLGHDEWAVLYNNYKVKQARITLQPGNTNTNPVILAVTRTDSTTGASGNMDSVCEQPATKWVTLATSTGGPSARTLKMGYVSSKQYPQLGKDDSLRPAFGNNPAEGNYWVVKMQSIDAGQTINLPILVTIDYIVELSVPKILTQS